MPTALSTTKAEVLLRASQLLEAKIPEFANRIHIVIDDEIPVSLQSNEILTVQIVGGQFDHGVQVGSPSTLLYQGTLRVSVWSHNRSDRQGTSRSMLTLSGRGLLRLETKILKALIGSYLQEADAGGNGFTPLLTDSIKALNDTQPQSAERDGSSVKATLSVDFGVDFHWDLNGDVDGEPE
jgi:hypothetical protein